MLIAWNRSGGVKREIIDFGTILGVSVDCRRTIGCVVLSKIVQTLWGKGQATTVTACIIDQLTLVVNVMGNSILSYSVYFRYVNLGKGAKKRRKKTLQALVLPLHIHTPL